ncbi:succinate dehydrogenase subunit 5, mitochondrial [Cornus florida]|uniref:succinate dehydrogenase subunit 5, mitochondrial n=1 Tax=Cornus florida TaxID=4283 RepID=UPI00289C3F1C|nr:succinate dehydrogenase subunit 5, mitochondrial [Cornus florida]
MEKIVTLRSLYRSIGFRSLSFSASASANQSHLRHGLRYLHLSPSSLPTSPKRFPSDCRPSFAMGIGSKRYFSEDVTHLPDIKDPEIHIVFKDLMAASWDELPDTLIHDAKKALSKNTDDKAGQEAMANVFRAAEAAEEFSGKLVSLRMEIDDCVGLSGENVKPLPDKFVNALRVAYQRYTAYLDAFGPDEVYLKKKVETELGTKMIHLKMRCSNLGSEWGKVTVLGTSGLSGSYVEQRA